MKARKTAKKKVAKKKIPRPPHGMVGKKNAYRGGNNTVVRSISIPIDINEEIMDYLPAGESFSGFVVAACRHYLDSPE